jgi:acetyl-CoA carboxylase biotin carboxyl carrier protein
MRKQEIEELIRLVEESQISELEVTHGRTRIRIARGGAPYAAHAPHPVAHAAPVPATAPAAPAGEEQLASNLKEIKSPMVGTFYRAPAPGSDAFVDVGQPVAVGQTVCIVEAMKLMNEIASDFGGVIRRVLIENGQPVEYGQPLFLVEVA